MSAAADDGGAKSFWRTLPGILTGLAGLVGAVGSLLVGLYATGILGGNGPSPSKVERLEGEGAVGVSADRVMARSEASGARTVLVFGGESLSLAFSLDNAASCVFAVRYSNDNFGDLEQVAVAVDGSATGGFDSRDTGGEGQGWNTFEMTDRIGPIDLLAGPHHVELTVVGGDGRGLEVDYVEADCAGKAG